MTRVLDKAKGARMQEQHPAPEAPPQQGHPLSGSDPWSDETWGQHALNVTFETVETDVFEFTAEENTDQQDDTPDDLEQSLFRGVKVAASAAAAPKRDMHPERRPVELPVVAVHMNEQLSAIYDDVSESPSCHLEGSIYVTPTVDMSRHSFRLVVRDLLDHIDVFEDRTAVAKDVTKEIPRKGLHRSDRVLRVSLPASATRKEVKVGRYICSGRLRPVPLLVKSRVQSSGQYSRVGFKIRANPANLTPLKRVVIMLAIPPHVNGRSGKLSRKGGLWDELKRTISWTIAEMPPGQALEIQAQFEILEGDANNSHARSPKFPILVRSEYENLFSSVELKVDYHDSLSKPIQVELENSARVLHRKV